MNISTTRECAVIMHSVRALTFECLDLQTSFFDTQVHFENIQVKVEYQGHGFKVKVIQAQLNGTYSRVVCLRLKGNLVICPMH